LNTEETEAPRLRAVGMKLLSPPARRAKIQGMSPPGTATVEIDQELLDRLRERRPEQSDRELVESLLRIQLGHEASDRAREAFAGTLSEEIEREAVKAAREVRAERAAAGAKIRA
jgi:hypothetical protein